MVSFWPWKGNDRSPESFEKALSVLSARITKTTTKLDTLRQRSRRLNVLWTLYAGFAYLLCTVILVLVVGWRNWSLVEYAAIAGGPIIIYAVRLGLSTYYEYRTSSLQASVNDIQKQRDSTIEKLKTATKYNSTQELLKKYGGTPTPKAKSTEESNRKVTPKQEVPSRISRTSFAPPPTANIAGRDGLPQIPIPQQEIMQQHHAFDPPRNGPRSPQSPSSPFDTSAEFAPNAFSSPPQYAQVSEGSRWYDRIMDVLLGEDETRPGARLALICNQCRLVNGQAPPGVKRLEDLGKWRCGGCGAMNGEESDVKKIVSSMQRESSDAPPHDEGGKKKGLVQSSDEEHHEASSPMETGQESDITQYSTEGSDEEMVTEKTMEINQKQATHVAASEAPRRRSTRSTKGKKTG